MLGYKIVLENQVTFLWWFYSLLTYSFRGSRFFLQDHRYNHLQKTHPILKYTIIWHLFNLIYISISQNIILLLLSSPIYICYLSRTTHPWTNFDTLALLLCIIFLLVKEIAEFQLRKFRERKESFEGFIKRRGIEVLEKDLVKGFYTHGLFRYSSKNKINCQFKNLK